VWKPHKDDEEVEENRVWIAIKCEAAEEHTGDLKDLETMCCHHLSSNG
jgi:hypothetical protein